MSHLVEQAKISLQDPQSPACASPAVSSLSAHTATEVSIPTTSTASVIRWMFVWIILASGILSTTAATCFPRICESELNCERVCDCIDTSNNQRFACPVFFSCDLAAGVCEDAYNTSCQEICETIAARGACGSKRCESENDCIRSTVCNVADANGNITGSFNCELAFACDAEAGVCEAAFAASDDAICQQCALQAQ